jgi:hypothetical protein
VAPWFGMAFAEFVLKVVSELWLRTYGLKEYRLDYA